MVSRVALIDPSSGEVLASVGSAHLSFSAREILNGHIKTALTLRFMRPRFIVHRDHDVGEENHLNSLMLEQPLASTTTPTEIFPSAPKETGPAVSHVEIHNGSFEIWDHTQSPTAKWVFDQLEGTYDQANRTVALVGRAICLGKEAVSTSITAARTRCRC